jgi:hypothetical protein
MNFISPTGLVCLGLLFVPCVLAAPFSPGNLIIYRVGTGTGGLLTSAAAVFLDEYSPAGSLVQSIPLPTAVAGAHRRLTASGTATSEGSIQRSADQRFLVFTGYDTDVGTPSVASIPAATVNRTVGFADVAGVVDTRTAVTAFSGQNIRSAASDDGTGAWLVGSSGGVVYTPLAGSGAGTVVSASSGNNRSVDIHGGQLYLSSSSGAFRLATVGAGLPRTTGNTTVQVPGGPTGTTSSPYQFVLFDLDATVAGLDTLYLADDLAGTGGIQKFCLVGGTWLAKGNVAGTGAATSIRGLTGSARGSIVTLYATNAIRLLSLTDSTGYNANLTGTLTELASAPGNTGFRGVDFAPVAAAPAPPPLTIAASGGAVTVSWPTSATGWFLQENANLTSGPWQPSTGVVDTGPVRSLTIPLTSGRKFFRLALP